MAGVEGGSDEGEGGSDWGGSDEGEAGNDWGGSGSNSGGGLAGDKIFPQSNS